MPLAWTTLGLSPFTAAVRADRLDTVVGAAEPPPVVPAPYPTGADSNEVAARAGAWCGAR
jgi:hypothetical protein